MLACCSARVITRPASSLTKESAARIEARVKKRANCAVYGFGLSASGALAIPALVVQDNRVTSRECHLPLRIPYCNLRDIKKVASGFGFTLFASRNKLYGTGLNNRLQVAGRILDEDKSKGGTETYYITGRRVGGLPEDAKILDIAAGRAHSLVIADDKVYAFGDNTYGQCGVHPDDAGDRIAATGEEEKPLLACVELPTDAKPVKVHCSLDTSFVLTDDGKIYAFGANDAGQCANASTTNIQPEPTQIVGETESERIATIAGSSDTIVAVSEKGQVFIWGRNEHGQTGGVGARDSVHVSHSRALPFDLPPCTSAAATATSCAVLTRDGTVCTWGVGPSVGHGPDHDMVQRPIRLPQPLFDNQLVREIVSGDATMAAINADGNVFVWGTNRYGMLGLGHDKDQLFPFPLFFREQVRQIALGPDHTLVLVK